MAEQNHLPTLPDIANLPKHLQLAAHSLDSGIFSSRPIKILVGEADNLTSHLLVEFVSQKANKLIKPHTFSEFFHLRQSLIKSAYFEEALSYSETHVKSSHAKIYPGFEEKIIALAILNLSGLITGKEFQVIYNHVDKNMDKLTFNQQTYNQFIPQLTTEPIPVNSDRVLENTQQAAEKIAQFRQQGFSTYIIFGGFDFTHGHAAFFDTVGSIAGSQAKIIALVNEDLEYQTIKKQTPKETQQNRVNKVASHKNITHACPIKIPNLKQALKKYKHPQDIKQFVFNSYVDLHQLLKPHFRAEGDPNHPLLPLFIDQCQQANISLLINDEGRSGTGESARELSNK